MTNLHLALLAFWSSFTWNGKPIPAFPESRVPENQPFPYITFEVIEGGFFSTNFPTAFIWCRQPMDGSINVQAQRASIMDQIARAIPESGRILRFDGGMVKLERNEGSFMSYYDPPEDNDENPTGEPVIGGRISVAVTFYIY